VVSWGSGADCAHAVDYRLVHNTFVTMFWRRSLLDDTIRWLIQHDYDVVTLDSATWRSAENMLTDMAEALDFPAYFGHSLNSLSDCLRDVAACDYGWRSEATGLVLVLINFERFAAADRLTAQRLLDIFADKARAAMLIGNRMMCIIQSNDPRSTFEPVGATPVIWNDAEWLDTNRGV
jgi:RNAse (barnase) inhibitor barstar